MHRLFHRIIPPHGRCELVVASDETVWIYANTTVSLGKLHYKYRFAFSTMEKAVRSFKEWNGHIINIAGVDYMASNTKRKLELTI